MVVVNCGGFFSNTLEEAKRAKTELILIIAGLGTFEKKKNIKAAADEGLVDLEVIESEIQIDVDVKVIENENSCVHCCIAM